MEFFITGTGTGIGKTFVTALLARAFVHRGLSTGVQKWVSTGSREMAEDLEFIGQNVPELFTQSVFSACLHSVYCLEFPASPHLAAEKEDVAISPDVIKRAFLGLKGRFDILMVEGAGGIMVPVTRKVMLVDIVQDIGLPVLVVAASGLGTINHTLLTLEVLGQRHIPCIGVVLNSQGLDPAFEEHPDIVADNARVIEEFSGVKVLGSLPRVEKFDEAAFFGTQIVRGIFEFSRPYR